MGYYSQVALCVSEKVEIPEATRSIMESIGFNQVGSCEGSRLFISEQMKWYSSYPVVSHLEDLIYSLDDEDHRFIRMGEDTDDNEFRGGFYDNPFNIGIERKFCYDELDDTL